MPIPVQQQPNGIKSGKVAGSLSSHQQDAATKTHHGPSTEQVNGISEHDRGQWTVIGKNGVGCACKAAISQEESENPRL